MLKSRCPGLRVSVYNQFCHPCLLYPVRFQGQVWCRDWGPDPHLGPPLPCRNWGPYPHPGHPIGTGVQTPHPDHHCTIETGVQTSTAPTQVPLSRPGRSSSLAGISFRRQRLGALLPLSLSVISQCTPLLLPMTCYRQSCSVWLFTSVSSEDLAHLPAVLLPHYPSLSSISSHPFSLPTSERIQSGS